MSVVYSPPVVCVLASELPHTPPFPHTLRWRSCLQAPPRRPAVLLLSGGTTSAGGETCLADYKKGIGWTQRLKTQESECV